MGRLLEVVAAGLRPHTTPQQLDRLLFRAGRDLYRFTYAFWGIEYRRVQSWRYALGVLLALAPSTIAAHLGLSRFRLILLWPIYLATAGLAMLTPIGAFDALRPYLYALAKRSR